MAVGFLDSVAKPELEQLNLKTGDSAAVAGFGFGIRTQWDRRRQS